MTDSGRGAQKGVSWTMSAAGVLFIALGAILAITGVGIAFAIPVLILGAAFVWLAMRTKPRG